MHTASSCITMGPAGFSLLVISIGCLSGNENLSLSFVFTLRLYLTILTVHLPAYPTLPTEILS